MKTVYVWILLFLFVAVSGMAQDVTGKWYGHANVGAMKLRLVFTIEKEGEAYKGTMLSPDQSSQEIPMDKVAWENGELTASVTRIGFTYKGSLKDDGTLQGVFTQGAAFTLNMSRTPFEIKRPQEPVPPFPYKVEEVAFRNEKVNVKLAGTLTMPEIGNKFTAVVMVTGSGPQNRNEELMGHKPFWVIADWLTRQGIAVLRYDERGVGESEGNYSACGIPDFAEDAAAAIAYLKTRKEINPQKIGVIGHSEGGAVAVILAAQRLPAFIVSLAGPGVNGREVMRSQREILFRKSGLTDDYIAQYNESMAKMEDMILDPEMDEPTLKDKLKTMLAGTAPSPEQVEATIKQLTAPALVSLLRYDPAIYFKDIKCPVLALNGDKDLQVISRPNLEGFKQIAMNGNKQVVTREYPNLNHLFQQSTTGLPTEYSQIEETIHPPVLKDMSEWILKQ